MVRKCECGRILTGTRALACQKCDVCLYEPVWSEVSQCMFWPCLDCGVHRVTDPGVMCDVCVAAGKMAEHTAHVAAHEEEWRKRAEGGGAEVVNLSAARGGMSAKEAADFLREMAESVERGAITAVVAVGVAVDEDARPGDVALARLRYTSSTEDLIKLAGIMAGEDLALRLRVAQSLGMVE